jgi:co-chaperonin GroES (HSP10)
MTIKLKPLKSNVLVKLIEKTKVTESGIVLTSADPAEPNFADVLKVGKKVKDVIVGERLLIDWTKAKKISLDNEDFYIVPEEHIIGVLEY